MGPKTAQVKSEACSSTFRNRLERIGISVDEMSATLCVLRAMELEKLRSGFFCRLCLDMSGADIFLTQCASVSFRCVLGFRTYVCNHRVAGAGIADVWVQLCATGVSAMCCVCCFDRAQCLWPIFFAFKMLISHVSFVAIRLSSHSQLDTS